MSVTHRHSVYEAPLRQHTTQRRVPPVRFFNLQRGYLVGDNILADLQYSHEFAVEQRDWIAILPAGCQKIGHFSALKMAPAKRAPAERGSARGFSKLTRSGGYGELHKVIFRAAETNVGFRIPGLFVQIGVQRSSVCSDPSINPFIRGQWARC